MWAWKRVARGCQDVEWKKPRGRRCATSSRGSLMQRDAIRVDLWFTQGLKNQRKRLACRFRPATAILALFHQSGSTASRVVNKPSCANSRNSNYPRVRRELCSTSRAIVSFGWVSGDSSRPDHSVSSIAKRPSSTDAPKHLKASREKGSVTPEVQTHQSD